MAPFDDAADLDVMMSDLGRPVTFAGVSGNGIVDDSDEELLADQAALVGRVIIVRVRTTAFPGLEVGVAGVVDGLAVTVREVIPEPLDAALSRVLCARA